MIHLLKVEPGTESLVIQSPEVINSTDGGPGARRWQEPSLELKVAPDNRMCLELNKW